MQTEAEFLDLLQGDLRAENTLRAYDSDFRNFAEFCRSRKVASLPASPETVISFLAWSLSVGAARSSVSRAVSGIAASHRKASVVDPTTDPSVRAAYRNLGKIRAQTKKGKPVSVEALREALPQGPGIQARDKALLLVGFGAGLRRSEIAALCVEDIEVHTEGLLVHIARSKTDTRGAGTVVGIHRGVHTGSCPVRAYEAWLQVRSMLPVQADALGSPLFVSATGKRITDRTVYAIVKNRLGDALSPHGALRAGFVTAAAKTGADAVKISFTSRHESMSVLKGYMRPATVFDNTVHLGL